MPTTPFHGLNRWLPLGLLALLMAVGPGRLHAAEPAAPATNTAARSAAQIAEAERTLRTYLQLQEQLHSALLAIEQARMENTAAARTNADAMAARLALIEKSLDQQREQQAQSLHQSNRTLLTLGGVLIGVGFLSLVAMVVFQVRSMNRMAEIAATAPLAPGFSAAALGAGDARLLGPGGGADTARLHGVIERLERRIQELEGSSRTAKLSAGTIDITPRPAERAASAPAPAAAPAPGEVLLGKGQALFSLGQHEGALRCFEEAVALSPDHAEAHLRRAQALERLKRLDEALAGYDQALELDRSLTQAYLGKGSVFNQQERFGEALDCYEQALRSESAAS